MDRPVTVIGGGGHAKVVIATLRDCGLCVDAVVDDDPTKIGGTLFGVPIVTTPEQFFERRRPRAVIAVGHNRRRREMAQRFPDLAWVTAVHPRAYVHPSVRLGRGTVVFAGAVIQPESSVGSHAIVNTGATIDHDCEVGDYVHLAPGVHVAGRVRIDEGALLGIGSAVAPGVSVGPWATIGAGACVLSDLAGNLTAVGVPARPLVREYS